MMKHHITSIHILKQQTNNFTPIGTISVDVPHFFALFELEETADHCAAVAAKAKELALHFDCDPAKAEQAGYLHDISAMIPNNRRIEFARNQNIAVLAEEEQFPMIIHQKLSAVIAREIFGISAEDVLSAIGCHTTLKANASKLDKVIFVADKIAWDQDGTPPYIHELLNALGRSLDAAALAYLDYLWAQRKQLRVVHPWFVEARNELLKEEG